jgi:hypothetical protein
LQAAAKKGGNDADKKNPKKNLLSGFSCPPQTRNYNQADRRPQHAAIVVQKTISDELF